MNVRLIFEKKGRRVWTSYVRGQIATLGRAVGCSIRIPSSQVSRLHCRVRVEDGVVTVEDLESVNGTFINGKRIHAVETVQPGDRLGLGALTFRVEYDAPDVEVLTEVEDELEVVEEPIDQLEEVSDDVVLLEPADEEEMSDFIIDLDETDERSP